MKTGALHYAANTLANCYRLIVWMGVVATCLSLFLTAGRPELLLIGMFIGFVFQYFSFGFANFWRQALVEKRTLGMRSHLLMLGVGGLLFFPALALLPAQGVEIQGAIRPVGVNVLFGAFLFGIGMALVGSCSSGTIRHMGTLNVRFYWVFVWMILGGTIAAAFAPWWQNLPAWSSFSLALQLPWFAGLALHFMVLWVVYRHLVTRENQRFGSVQPLFSKLSPLLWAAFLLALLNFIVLLVNHSPWAMSWLFPKLGISIVQMLSIPVEWEFWEFTAQNQVSLEKSLLQDSIVLTSVGMILGVFIAFWWQGSAGSKADKPSSPVSRQTKSFQFVIKDPVMGGLMGFGAVTAYGCNVGGFFSGIVSGSLHGWLWMLAALAGMSFAIFLSKRLSGRFVRQAR